MFWVSLVKGHFKLQRQFYKELPLFSAQDWIRTSTPFRVPPPQGGLSTNFNTWAGMQMYN